MTYKPSKLGQTDLVLSIWSEFISRSVCAGLQVYCYDLCYTRSDSCWLVILLAQVAKNDTFIKCTFYQYSIRSTVKDSHLLSVCRNYLCYKKYWCSLLFRLQFKYAKISSKINGVVKKGVIFSTYSSLIGESQAGGKYRTRLKQLVHWLGKEFDGLVSSVLIDVTLLSIVVIISVLLTLRIAPVYQDEVDNFVKC